MAEIDKNMSKEEYTNHFISLVKEKVENIFWDELEWNKHLKDDEIWIFFNYYDPKSHKISVWRDKKLALANFLLSGCNFNDYETIREDQKYEFYEKSRFFGFFPVGKNLVARLMKSKIMDFKGK